MMVRVRFAPSPTGFLHLGNARTALLNALFARHSSGTFILRIDDTDMARSRTEYLEGIQEDLKWLGLDWDQMFVQSQRKDIHAMYFSKLLEMGRIYPCFETEEQLDAQRKAQLKQGSPPVYDRIKGQGVPKHDQPHWRFSLEDTTVCWEDAIQGAMSYGARHLSDPVVMRQDGSMSYLLSSVIDDVDLGITHILRGSDHLTNTAIQIQMMQALQGHVPIWAHFPLMFNAEGEKFSKRTGSKTLRELREEGWLPLAIVQALAQLGLSRMIEGDLSEMIAAFSLSEYSKSNAKFSIHDIELAQGRLWSNMIYEDLPVALKEVIRPDIFQVVQNNCVQTSDLDFWQRVCVQKEMHLAVDQAISQVGPLPKDFFKGARDLLESASILSENLENPEDRVWGPDPWHMWVDGMVARFPQCKKGAICRALRGVLTGKSGGPKMDQLLPIMHPEVVVYRLETCSVSPES